MEIFKEIEGYQGLYEVSNKGRVRSLKRDAFLKMDITVANATSYARVTLSKDGVTQRFMVHRLVAQAFLPNPEGKPQVNHKDNDGLNNAVENLEWCTQAENMQHSVKQGRQELVQKNITQAAIPKVYERYRALWHGRLKDRFVAYYSAHQVKTNGEKPAAAIAYLCSDCGTLRHAMTHWRELTRHNGKCPNCTLVAEIIVDEDIVSTT